ncbi:MAG: hypothetical protein Kow0098_29590 [Ignavibacteriaceae bacterium]
MFKKTSFDIFDLMKKILQSSVFKKSLAGFGIFIVLVIILDQLLIPWYVSSPEKTVPDVVKLSREEAFQILKEAGFEPFIYDTTYNNSFPAGTIVLQKPSAGEKVKEGRVVYLYLSGGEPIVKVPSLKGKSIRDAKFALERLGLKLGNIEEVSSAQPKDVIIDQQYVQGTQLKKGQTVGVSVSIGRGGGTIEVPDLIGKSLSEATRILRDSSLTIGKINYQQSFSLLPNTILDQYPSKGSKLNPNDKVDLFVTKSANGSDVERAE